MKVGVLTGGGDCPGLNAVIRAVVRKGIRHWGDEVYGFYDGWKGVMSGEGEWLDVARLRGTLPRGGTILGTSRIQPYASEGGCDLVQATLERLGIEALIVIGGEGTLSCARSIQLDGVANVIGVPKTIDNDINGTERTFGFDTAVSIATEAIDRLHTTAESHDRVMVVEVMGRHVGHIAAWAGLAGGATITLIPEEPFDIASVAAALNRRHAGTKFASIVVVAEGAVPAEGTIDYREPEVDQFGHKRLGGVAHLVAREIEERTGIETRVTILGHVQRGGTPTASDRVLCSRLGVHAIDAVHNGDFGHMVSLNADQIGVISLDEAVSSLKYVNPQLWETAKVFHGNAGDHPPESSDS